MININIRESLRELDNDTCCKYNLLTMYDSCNLSDDDKGKLVKLLYDKEDPEVIYQNLCIYFCDDDVSGIDDINDVLVSSAFETIITECVSKLKEKYDDAKYNDVSNQLEVITNGTLYTTGVSPVDYDVSDIEVFVDGNYDEPIIFSNIQDAIKYILDVVSNKINTISIIEGDDDIMVYTIYDIVEDEDRLTAKCMNESTNDFQDIKLGKTSSQKVNELLNNMLNNPNYRITDEVKKKIYDKSAPWGLAVQMVPSVDIDGTNGLLSTGSFSGEASFSESLEEFFEKDDRVTDGDRQGTVIDCDSEKVLVEWDYSDTDDIEWVDKSDIEVIKIDRKLYEFVQQPVNNKDIEDACKTLGIDFIGLEYKSQDPEFSNNDTYTKQGKSNDIAGYETKVKNSGRLIQSSSPKGKYYREYILNNVLVHFDYSDKGRSKIVLIPRNQMVDSLYKEHTKESSDVSGRYVYFDYDTVGKQPRSDEVVSAYNDKYFENISNVKLKKVGYNYMQKEIEYIATDNYGDRFHVVVGHAPNPIEESISPYKKREFKKQLQDELYNVTTDKMLNDPEWGYEDLEQIDDLVGLVIEVEDYKGDYDNDFVAEIRGEFTYDELEDIGDSLNPIVQKYDKEAYFEPVTSGITRAYITLEESINESRGPNADRLRELIDDGIVSKDLIVNEFINYLSEDDIQDFLSEYDLVNELSEDVKNDISGRYVWFNYNEVGKQPRSDEVVYAYNSKYFDNISHVKLEYSGHDYLNHEFIYIATDNNGHKFRVVVGHVPTSFKESDEDLYDDASEHLMDLIENEVSSEVVDYYIDNFGSSFIITYNNNLDNIRNEAINLSDTLTKNGYKVRDWDTNGNNVVILRFAKPVSLNEGIENDDELISAEQEFDSAATSINSNKLPAVYSRVRFNPGDVVVDFGGGKFDNAVNYLKDQDVTLLVYDPYNRSAKHNKEVLKVLREHGGADAAVNSNVLNVIKEPEARNAVLQNIKKITKKGAPIYITVYEGTGKGNEGPTKSGYQLNRKTADYIDEIGQVFSNVKRKGKLITAINESYYTGSDLRQANLDALEYLIEFEDIYPFPKGEFLAADWKELRDGVAMGMDDDLEIAEGIMEYLQKEIDFNNKHKEIYEDDPSSRINIRNL